MVLKILMSILEVERILVFLNNFRRGAVLAKKITCSTSGDADIVCYNYVEISMDPHLLNNFANEDGIGSFLMAHSCSEEFQRLKHRLLKEVLDIIENDLTENQRRIVKMTFVDGMTQDAISKKLGRCQTCIHKNLKGNLDYTNNGKRYGGAIKKIKKLCYKNEKILKILEEMKNYSIVSG